MSISTSGQLEVALKFSGERGMILEMDNSKGDGRLLQGMNCSWISRYKEEDERYLYYKSLYIFIIIRLFLL